MIIQTKNLEAYPLIASNFNEATVKKVHKLISTVVKHESYLTGYRSGCGSGCGICDDCLEVRRIVTANLTDPKAVAWEVWERDDDTGELLDFVGILRLSQFTIGCDATAQYYFFDGKLRDKTALLKAWVRWLFDDHPEWLGLHRVSVEIPAHAFALARHASKHLGFGGPFKYRANNVTIPVEGVKRDAILWRGNWHDILLLGKVNDGGRS